MKIAIMPLTQPGADSIAEAKDVGLCAIHDMPGALAMSWPRDLFFTCYTLPEDQDDGWPRLNNGCLNEMRKVTGNHCYVMMPYLALDFDLPEHGEWDVESAALFSELLADMAQTKYPVRNWRWMYRTKRGARLIYRLSRPITPEDYEALYIGVLDQWEPFINFDRTVGQWNRLFRLPRVNRDGKRTADHPFFEFEENLDAVLDVDSVEPGQPKKRSADFKDAKPLDIGQPDQLEAEALVWAEDEEPTDWGRSARKRLIGRECYPCLFEHAPLALVGSRDHTIQRFVGQACAMLANLPDTTAAHIFGLFLRPIVQLDPDEQTPDWTAVLWRAICRYYPREEAKAATEAAQAAVEAEIEREKVADVENFAMGIAKRMSRWCAAPELKSDKPSEVLAFLSTHALAMHSGSGAVYPLNPHGLYESVSVVHSALIPFLRRTGMDRLMNTYREGGKDRTRDATITEMINCHSTVVHRLEGVASQMGTHIADIDTPQATLRIQLYSRNPKVKASYDPDVDCWLREMCGSERDYTRLAHWISHALNFEGGPICALSLAGPPGVGKKMFAQGLAECVNTETFADSGVFGAYQSELMRTPFVFINEGFPAYEKGAKSIADYFRQVTAGDPIVVNEKYRPTTIIRSPLRVVLTANNLEVVGALAGGRDLSDDDRRAIGQRLMHIDLSEDGVRWLMAKGGVHFTAQPGRRWIRADAGDSSDYIVAGHFMWLYETRQPPHSDRLLVQGGSEQQIVRSFARSSGSAPIVLESLCKMVEANGAIDGLVVKGGYIFVVPSSIVDFARCRMPQGTASDITVRKVVKVLHGIEIRSSHRKRDDVFMLPEEFGNDRKARWWEINPELLLEEAQEWGYKHDRIKKIVSDHKRKSIANVRSEIF